jgi:leucyl-tRNA synthetase
MNDAYEAHQVETAAQSFWDENQSFIIKENLNQEKFYCLSMLPYPSGELHMGHIRNYTIGDVITRYQKMNNKNVLQPMGWDAFGLPAENAAIKHKLPPAAWTEKNIKKMRKQFQQMGYAFDWSREFATCHPSYYRWEQWLFVQLFKKGVVYKKNSVVNWDPVDNTVLANEQVIDGKGWRSGAEIERKEIPQWFLKITNYAEELLQDLDKLDGWPEQVKLMQKNWIGKSSGFSIKFKVIKRTKEYLEIFTTRPDTLMGVTYLGIAMEHPLAKEAASSNKEIASFIKTMTKSTVSEAELSRNDKAGIFTGLHAKHPVTKKKIPIWITNFVLMEYGSGAVMAVPAHDQRDFEFAQQYQLPIQPVLLPPQKEQWDYNTAAYTGKGTLIKSGEFNQLKFNEACKAINSFLEKQDLGEKKTTYRLRDWGVSRQRYWGTPIPIIECKDCGSVPVPESDLPVILPTDLVPDGKKSPLKTSAAFYKTKCPQCGKAAKRETDTMDTFMESSWYYARYACPNQDTAMLDDRAKYWTPVDQYVGGIEHAVLHLLYARFMHKVLRDLGLLNSDEPFNKLLTQGMVLKDGAKMSKSKGNTVSPQRLIKKYGADTVRFFIIFTAPPEQDLEWSDAGVDGAYRFINKVWQLGKKHQANILESGDDNYNRISSPEESTLEEIYRKIHAILKQANHDIEKQQLNTVASASMKIYNAMAKMDTSTTTSAKLFQHGFSILLRILSPITPHLSHQLWQDLGYPGELLTSPWPKHDPKALVSNVIEIMIQINGKLRSKIKIAADSDNEQIMNLVNNDEKIQALIQGKNIKKHIIVPGKLVNLVV